jgi:two-component system, LuxR family, sensor kinase FixL
MKHGQAKHLLIRLGPCGGGIALSVQDDGVGIPDELGNSPGMGLHIMNYRAKMIGGKIEILRRPEGGTVVICSLPSRSGKEALRS